MEDKIKELVHTVTTKKMNMHDYSIQEIWDPIKRPNLRIHGIERAEIQIISIENIFNEIKIEN
jgi:hypothetical protein